jgi:hypothetical protein
LKTKAFDDLKDEMYEELAKLQDNSVNFFEFMELKKGLDKIWDEKEREYKKLFEEEEEKIVVQVSLKPYAVFSKTISRIKP